MDGTRHFGAGGYADPPLRDVISMATTPVYREYQ
jgi:hypothetical protein